MLKKSIALFAVLCNLLAFAYDETTFPPEQMVSFLDCSSSPFNNPLVGITHFTVLAPNESSQTQLFIEELEKLGSVKRFYLSDPNGIDFEGMGTGVSLFFLTTSLSLIDETETDLIRTTLSLSTSVEVLKTKSHISSYIWASHVFSVKGQENDAARKVVQQFAAYYKSANPNTKPTFYIYQ